MTIVLLFASLLFSIGLIGWHAWHFLLTTGDFEACKNVRCREYGLLPCFLIFLAGFSALSLILFLWAHFNAFSWKTIIVSLVLFFGFCIFRSIRRNQTFSILFPPVVFHTLLLVIGLVTAVVFLLARPQQTFVSASDAPVYLATAQNLADKGSLVYTDDFVREMTEKETETFFHGWRVDGKYVDQIRFTGGVLLKEPSEGTVVFSFYHLFPAWMALGKKFFGTEGSLILMSFFAALSLISLFFIGQRIGGPYLALGIVSLQLVFFPQLYFSSFPISEMLAQALFLGGLLVLVHGVEKEGSPIGKQYQALAGITWGAMLFCRIDLIFYVVLCITVCFTFIAPLRGKIKQWRTLICILFLFTGFAFFHQIMTGVYLRLFSKLTLIPWKMVVAFSDLAMRHPLASHLLFVLLSATGLFVLKQWGNSRPRKALGIIGMVLGASLSIVMLWAMCRKTNMALIRLHLEWLTYYLEAELIVFMMIGVLLAVYEGIYRKRRIGIGMVFIFFVIPAFCYLLDSMVSHFQPWAIRRFVPMVFPLFFALSLAGFHYFLRHIFVNRSRLYPILFFIPVTAIFLIFLSDSIVFIKKPVFSGVMEQITPLENKIPKESVIIIPERESGFHLQCPLQYQLGNDTLVLRLNPRKKMTHSVLADFLHKQTQKGRPVMIVMNPQNNLLGPLAKDFFLSPEFEHEISLEWVPPLRKIHFPNVTQTLVHPLMGFRLREHEPGKFPEEFSIDIGDWKSDLPWLIEGFFSIDANALEPDKSFRWTENTARMVLPDSLPHVALLLQTARPSGAGSRLDLKISVNGLQVAHIPESRSEKQWVYFTIPPQIEKDGKPLVLTLRCNTFCPRKLGFSQDKRKLGVRLFQVQLTKHLDRTDVSPEGKKVTLSSLPAIPILSDSLIPSQLDPGK